MSTDRYFHILPVGAVVLEDDGFETELDLDPQVRLDLDPQFNVDFQRTIRKGKLLNENWANHELDSFGPDGKFDTWRKLYRLCGQPLTESLVDQIVDLYRHYCSFFHEVVTTPYSLRLVLADSIGKTFYLRTD